MDQETVQIIGGSATIVFIISFVVFIWGIVITFLPTWLVITFIVLLASIITMIVCFQKDKDEVETTSE